ncbi:MAG TPA: ABC transporter ATP-binding protein [Kineosporiaceae bacterium]
MELLEVRDLHVSFPTPDGLVQAVRGVDFTVRAGTTLSIVGESGSGKSVATQTITGLTRGARVTGEARFDGDDLLKMDGEALRRIRGKQIGMIFQDPLSSLHPYYTVGWQIAELIREHENGTSKAQARARAVDLLKLVGIPYAERRVDDYPHQFSGGMRQRAMIAMAMAMNPRLLIADEPTTALDVTVQAQVLRVMRRLQVEFGTAIILITHDLGVVADLSDDVVVMYAGRPMEKADRREIFYSRHHPYTEGLLQSIPVPGHRVRLTPISGQPPSLVTPPPACPFHPRCPYAFDRCHQETPPLRPVNMSPTHLSACWLPLDPDGRVQARDELHRRRSGSTGEGARTDATSVTAAPSRTATSQPSAGA